jgi:hypothetical protein
VICSGKAIDRDTHNAILGLRSLIFVEVREIEKQVDPPLNCAIVQDDYVFSASSNPDSRVPAISKE